MLLFQHMPILEYVSPFSGMFLLRSVLSGTSSFQDRSFLDVSCVRTRPFSDILLLEYVFPQHIHSKICLCILLCHVLSTTCSFQTCLFQDMFLLGHAHLNWMCLFQLPGYHVCVITFYLINFFDHVHVIYFVTFFCYYFSPFLFFLTI